MTEHQTDAPSPRRVARQVRAFTTQLRHPIEFADQLDESWTAEAAVADAKRELARVQGEITRVTDDFAAAQTTETDRLARRRGEVDEAMASLNAQLERARAGLAESMATLSAKAQEAETMAEERMRTAEQRASSAEERLRQLMADIDAAARRRDAVRAELAAAANALAQG